MLVGLKIKERGRRRTIVRRSSSTLSMNRGEKSIRREREGRQAYLRRILFQQHLKLCCAFPAWIESGG